MSKKQISITRVSEWMHRNARELDLAIWKVLFENGENSTVADALLFYQNDDGGFGHGLDMDNWNPDSLPYNCVVALDLLRMVGYEDRKHPVFKGIKKYLNETGPERWLFTVPGNENYPHASFYDYSEEYNKAQSIGVVIELSAFVIEHCRELPVYEKVTEGLDGFIARFQSDDLGDMGPAGYISLIGAMKRTGIPGYDYNALEKRLSEVINGTMQRSPEEWQYYGYRPSDFIKSRNSVFYQGNESVVEQELDFLVDTMPVNDIWPVSWCWFNNNELYPKEEVISLRTAQARKGIEKMIFLRAFGRVALL